VQVDPSDLGVRVTTDPFVVRQFLDSDEDIVVFTTYHSSPIVAAACSDDRPFDLVICDEAHWCAGDLDAAYATPLREDDIPAARRLFLTATPRIFSEEQKTQAADRGHRLASMDDDELFGPVVHHLPFGRAIELGLLADYRVVVCVVDDNERMRLVRDRRLVTTGDGHVTDAGLLATHVLVARAMRRFDLTRTLTFHGRVARAAEFSERLPKVVEWMPEDEAPIGRLTARHVHGQMPTQTREAILGALRELPPGERALVSNVRCLAEGVDVPAIDSVAIVDPKRSRNEIIQAVGRALRAHGDDGKVATVIVPAFVAKDQSIHSALTDEAFQPVWNVLAALRDQDERLADEIDALRFELGTRTAIDRRPGRIELQVAEEVGVEFVEAFNARLAREIGTTPQTQIRTGQIRLRPPEDEEEVVYRRAAREDDEVNLSLIPVGIEALDRFVRRNGHARVPKGHREDGFGLGDWLLVTLHVLDNQHQGYLDSIFSEDQAEKFARLVRAVDLPFGEYPNLQEQVDLLDSLPRFRDAVARGRVPAEFADLGTVRVSDFPASVPADLTTIGGVRKWWEPDNGDWQLHNGVYHQVIFQLDPTTHAERYEAAVIALGTLGYLEDRTRERPANEYGPFQAGFADGLAETSLQGCLIDRVAARYRQNYSRVWIYVAGWELGKKARRSSFAFNARVAA
jgi:superfamily II DNA or RNA helicase